MERKHVNCDLESLTRFMDGELAAKERQSVAAHIEGCSDCRRILVENRRLSSLLRSGVNKGLADVDFQEVENGLQQRLSRGRAEGENRWVRSRRLVPAGLIPSKRVYIPAATAAAVVFFVWIFFGRPTEVTGPSAIVKSFQGSVQSVMILETPNSHETILWYSEREVTTDKRPVDDDTLGHRHSSWAVSA